MLWSCSLLYVLFSNYFYSSGGQRGATLQNLRGTRGADFEGIADIERGHTPGCCVPTGRVLDKKVITLIKGPFLFVFKKETDKSPKYAVSLTNLVAVLESPAGKSYPTSLQTSLGDLEYELVFNDAEAASKFVEVANEQAAGGQAEIVRKRLGHEKLLTKRSSMRYAENIAVEKIKEQPDKPLTTGEIMEYGVNPMDTPM